MTDEKETKTSPRKRRPRRRSVSKQFGKGAYVDNAAELHQGRVLAMQALFEMDSAQRDLDEILQRIRSGSGELPESALATTDEDELAVDDVPGEIAAHAEQLARGTAVHLHEIDPVIEQAAPAFPIAQIAMVDRNVLRLAIFELYHHTDVPFRVVINEAVEIAKRFGGPNSGRFVNGVLGTVGKQLPEERRES